MNPLSSTSGRTWSLWAALSAALTGALLLPLYSNEGNKELFLPGETTHGHYQIELECGECHTEQFSDGAVLQGACVKCHGDDLEKSNDSHPESKFTDPRNAARVEQLDARLCVTCHSEHQPTRTGSMGLSLPEDYCYQCHQDIAKDRPSHAGLAFNSCDDVGCHNFHDNKALYEDYLVRHAGESPLLPEPFRELSATGECPAPAREKLNDKTPLDACSECHEAEVGSFTSGRHGMRLAAGLSPLKVRDARQPMKASARNRNMTCASCHTKGASSGRIDPVAGVDNCLSCHDDKHSRAYKGSKHFLTLQAELDKKVAAGSGVTCSTCHMPRLEDDNGKLWVDHNQNHNLRPVEQMVRTVCGNCHGLPFVLDALASPELLENNFAGSPENHVKSVDFAVSRQ